MMQAEIAVLRFGLGARLGDLAAAAGDPRGWLLAQIAGGVPLVGNARLEPSGTIFTELQAAREELQDMKRETATAASAAAAPAAAASPIRNPVRDASLPHYRAQVLARAQSAALTTRPFAERLVHFWTNHFAVSADKGAVFGIAGTLENEAIRPHVGGRFVELLTAVERHPAMIAFLDNQYSVGKDSELALLAARPFRKPPIDVSDMPKREFGINEKPGAGDSRASHPRRERRLHANRCHSIRPNHHGMVDRRRKGPARRRNSRLLLLSR
jgi:uncharacterized protein (DUF1800 family)